MFDLINKFKDENEKKNLPSQERSTRITRSKTDKQLEKPKFKLDLKKNSYSVRVISKWNSLPLSIRESKSLDTFKQNVKSYLLTKQ